MNLQKLKSRAEKMKTCLSVLYLAFKDKRTPWYAKAIVFMVVSYALSPIDLIPDFIPVLGYLDDLILIPAGITLAIKLVPDEVLRECRDKAGNSSGVKINTMYAVILIAAIWLILLYLMIRAIINF